jgi:hypothetical protein
MQRRSSDFYSRQLFRKPVTPGRLMSLKQGLNLCEDRQKPLEYRSLLDFIQNGCERLWEEAEEGFVNDATLLAVVEKQLVKAKSKRT